MKRRSLIKAFTLSASIAAMGMTWTVQAAETIKVGILHSLSGTMAISETSLKDMALMTGVLVAISGSIGFVGLMIPHIARRLVGAEHRRLLPVSALVGSVFLVWVDVAARTLIAPEDLPIGVATAAIGGVFFIGLMRRR